MPIEIRTGDLFKSGSHTLVNPVNCEGVMGAGLALQFKQRYPGMFARYRVLCRAGNIVPGSIMFDDGDGQHIANLATKGYWRSPSRLEWIDDGLTTLAQHIEEEGVPSVAVPPLGCGLGGLDFRDVFPLMVRHLKSDSCHVMLYTEARYIQFAKEALEQGNGGA
ncbi:macro domain-containing protein [Streptomyces sp. 5-10]|uniref:macro domain-containing protein n=1 Tax=Streptomyces sp. 5-10 TaxID=878925 RepID=UPI00168BFCA6|nr:macro domain-containing protein [Streptomyces sp. 5-10]MBD3004739.1 macro domain-containing protein [Streptomyces sp. 5-10]